MVERKANWKEIFILIGLLLAVLLPRVFQLDRFVTSDENLWLTASGNFYYALAQRQPQETYRFEAPAITSTWAGVFGYLLEAPDYRGWGQGYLPREKLERVLERHDVAAIDVLAAGRLFVVLQVAAVLLLIYYYARRLLPILAAMMGLLILIFDPFFLGLTRVLHMDGLLAAYMLLSVLAYQSYLYRGRRRIDLAAAGIAFGLSLLSKSPGIFLLPFLGLQTILAAWRQGAFKPFRPFARTYLAPLLLCFTAAALTFFLLWPAMWVTPGEVINNVFIWAFRFASGGHDTAVFFNGQVFIDTDIGLDLWNYYPLTFLWRTTPLVLIGLGLAVFLGRKHPSEDPDDVARVAGQRFILIDLALLAFFFTVFMTLGGKKFDRYLIPAYLPLDLIAGVGWALAAQRLKASPGRKQVYARLLLGAVVAAQAGLALVHFPYYFTYFNPLMGGAARAPQVMQIGWGEGLDQAAEYLAEKPNAKNLTVVSWYGEGPFSYFFPGETLTIWIQPDWQRANARSLLEADYIVVYIHQAQRQMTDVLLDVLGEVEPERVIEIQGLPYAEIYAINDIPEAGMERLLAPVPNRTAP